MDAPAHRPEPGLTWEHADPSLLGLTAQVQDDLQFEVADIDTELGQVIIGFGADGETELAFYDDTTFLATAGGEVTMDTRSRTLTHLSYVLETFVPPIAEGEAAPNQRRTHVRYDLSVTPR